MKKCFISVVISTLLFSGLFASTWAINGSCLPSNDEKFAEYSNQFLYYFNEIRSWHPNILPEASVATENLHTYLTTLKNPNYDTQLLQLLTMRCLYNVDKVSANQITDFVNKLNAEFPDRAEHHWIYANFWTTTTHSSDAIDEYNKYLELTDGLVNTEFLQNYAYANMLAGKKLTAIHAIKAAANFGGYNLEDDPLYKNLNENIISYEPGTNLPKEKLWKMTYANEEGKYFFDSTLIGISMKVNGTWNINFSGLENNSPATVLIHPDAFKYKNNDISLSLLLIAYPQTITPANWMENTLSKFKIIKKETKSIKDNDFTVYTYEDLDKYNDFRKGSRGYIYSATILPTENSGTRCEHIIDLSKIRNKDDAQKMQYYQMAETYSRIPEPINIMILVDSCNAISNETQQWINDFMNNAIFE
ncbi:MAG: hypothetical protein MJ188_09835 [Treponema sp.]|nr:hypothetical protein [Treponema sp.]